MGDDQAGAASPPQVLVDRLLGQRIERAGRLVEDQDGRASGQRAGDLETLTLAAAEVLAALGDRVVVAAGP